MSTLLKQLPPFSGREEDWQTWHFKFRSWCCLVGIKEMIEVAGKAENVIANQTLSEEQQAVSRQLYHILVTTTSGRALAKLKEVQSGEGLEGYRLLVSHYEPKVGGRFASMLSTILTPQFGEDLEKFFNDEFPSWERSVQQYEMQSGETIAASIRVATVMRTAPSQVRASLRLTVMDSKNYEAVRQRLEQIRLTTLYYEGSARTKTPTATSSSSTNATGSSMLPVPMEVDAVKGLGKGKGKRGSLQGNYGRGKDKFEKMDVSASEDRYEESKHYGSDIVCYECGRNGHRARDCPRRRVQEDDRGGPECFRCGRRGHRARDCQHARHADGRNLIAQVGDVEEKKVDINSVVEKQSDASEKGWVFNFADGDALREQSRVEYLLVDSGASVHCCPSTFASSYPLSRATSEGAKLRTASGQVLRKVGTRHVNFELFNGERGHVDFVAVKGLERPLLSTQLLAEKGWSTVISREGAFLQRGDDRVQLSFWKGLYYLPVKLVERKQVEHIHLIDSDSATIEDYEEKWQKKGEILSRDERVKYHDVEPKNFRREKFRECKVATGTRKFDSTTGKRKFDSKNVQRKEFEKLNVEKVESEGARLSARNFEDSELVSEERVKEKDVKNENGQLENESEWKTVSRKKRNERTSDRYSGERRNYLEEKFGDQNVTEDAGESDSAATAERQGDLTKSELSE